jgi:hypothetical protein
MSETNWAANVILVDADYVGRVAFDLTVNFERMLGRRIPAADLCRWLDCIALDGGLRPGDHSIQVVFIHDKKTLRFPYFTPNDFAADLDAKAFRDALGEFSLSAVTVEDIVSKSELFVQALDNILAADTVQRIMVVGDMEDYGTAVKHAVAAHDGKEVTLFAMEPLNGRGFAQEILGYSLLSALGIQANEVQG